MSDPSPIPHDAVESLIRVAGRREPPPEKAYQQALDAMTQAWRAKVRRRRLRTYSAYAAGIAALSLAAMLALQSFAPAPATLEQVARVARVIGAVQVRSTDADEWTSVQESAEPLLAGSTLRTQANAGAALQIGDISVRLADRAELVLESSGRLQLMRGKLYIDTQRGRSGGILVVTRAASVTDLGTQFEVQYDGSDYRVRVREGTVLLETGSMRRSASAGEQIDVEASGAVIRSEIDADDASWRWVESLASAPEIDNQPLTVLLAWVARESGVTVRYASPAIERKATATILHGSIRRLAPLEALEVMMATTDLRHEVLSDGTILIQ